MAFQFKRDRGDNITLILAGDIDLEVTPEIKPSFQPIRRCCLAHN